MSCTNLGRTWDLLDGELRGEEARAAREHLDSCADCREERLRHAGLLERAAALPRELEPGRDLWPGIAARLRGPRVLGFSPKGEPRPRRARPLGLLAAAAALVAVSSAVTALLMRPEPRPEPGGERSLVTATAPEADPLLKAERDYERAAAELMAALEEQRDLLSPETRDSIEANLTVMDRALADLRAALESDPGNRELARLFNTTHRKRVELLRGAVRLSQS